MEATADTATLVNMAHHTYEISGCVVLGTAKYRDGIRSGS